MNSSKIRRERVCKLINDDCLKVLKNIPDNSIDLIVTDPPYKVTSRGNAGNSGGMLQSDKFMKGKVFTYNDIDCSQYAPEFFRILKDSTHCYIMTNHINLINMLNVFTNNGFRFVKSLIWSKGNKIMGHYYMSSYEYILFFRKGKGKMINHCGTSDILSVPNHKTKGIDSKNLHDTEKPAELMRILIENSSQPNEIVLDPFMGIGSSGVAALNNNRNFIGIEIANNYFNIATERINQCQ